MKSNNKCKFTLITEKKIVKLYQYFTASKIAKKMGCSAGTVINIIRRHHGFVRPKLGRERVWSKKDIFRILKMWDAGLSKWTIGNLFVSDTRTIEKVLVKNGRKIEQRLPGGSKHYNWKGGRYKHTDGYFLVSLRSHHKFRSMAQKHGRILEHRLVMAEKIGRPLYPYEQVHHKDGNKDNNHPDNLDLRLGAHGPGVKYICQDCHSQNVLPIALDAVI